MAFVEYTGWGCNCDGSSDQFINARVGIGGEVTHLIVVYAAPTVSRRSGLWGQLRKVIQAVQEPMLIGGDFKTIVRLDERTGGNGRLSPDSLAFGSWINELELIDMGFRGNSFTWKRGREERNFVAKRLDRVLCSAQLRLKWQEAVVSHLPFLASDHAPIYIQLQPELCVNPRRRPFRFEAAWLKHQGFKELLSTSWNGSPSTPKPLLSLKTKLKKWNRKVFGDVQTRKQRLMDDIQALQETLETHQTNDLLDREADLLKELDAVLEQEEVLWYQKSREKWVALGDRNTKYYHTSTIIRRRRNRIETLQDDTGRWISEPTELEELALAYYKRLYSIEDLEMETASLTSEGFVVLTRDEIVALNKPFTEADVEASIRSMGKYKSPGPDGYQPVFYQECWGVVGASVTRFVLEFFTSGNLPEGTNAAMVVLLGKVMKPERITQFRPISLCNVLFKTITKVMVLRLKKIMPKLIGPSQASFIPGRLSTDNIILVQEAVHSIRRKKGRKGWMLLKLDLEKAYDRIRWDFLEDTLKAAQLPEMWVRWIMKCVVDPDMSLLWNGERTEMFKPQRGLRQGDPLSPYLFVLCLERLCHQIEFSVAAKEWKPICLSRAGPKLSHVCFADDLILFAEASVAQIRIIRRVLEKFCAASGQKVSLEKSKIFFSDNVSRNLAVVISTESGISATTELGKYLGIPILQKRINKDTFGETIEKISSRLAGWKGRFLSLAGRITLTKSVLTSIPVHTMSTVVLPKSTLKKLDSVSRSFIWGSTVEQRKQHLISWKRICRPKEEGGLGIRLAKNMNKALLAKLGWRLMNDNSGLWAKVLKSKYRVKEAGDGVLWTVTKGKWSSTWRSMMLGIREVVLPWMSWVIGNGHQIRFWQDRWLLNKPLLDLAINEVLGHLREAKVREFWRNGMGWATQSLTTLLPYNIHLQLASVVVDEVTGAKDRVSWGESQDGEFSVKSAYNYITKGEVPGQNMSMLFKRVWRVVVPERVRVFLWLVANEAIMTNMERHRRHLSESGICQVCRGGNESILHVLRDCPATAGIWKRLVSAGRQHDFFTQSLLEWLYGNLAADVTGQDSAWATLFALVVWWSWKWRCGYVFGVHGKCRDIVKFVKDLAQESILAHSKFKGNSQVVARVERQIAWSRPMEGWVKLNTDGASRGNPGLATAGGVLRNAAGDWCGGFAINIGICSAPLAELWGVYYGLCLAWEHRITRLELEVDSEMVVRFLQTGISKSHPLSFLVRLCYGFISRDWIVKILYVHREANYLADGLANFAFSLPLGLHVFDFVPEDVRTLVSEDAIGRTRPRHVRM